MGNLLKPLALIAILTVLLLVISQEHLVDAIKCYVCQSNVDPKCADPFDNLTLPITDCDAYPRADLVPKTEYDLVEEKGFSLFGQQTPVKTLRASMCRKIRQKVSGEWRTIRGCGYLGAPADGQDIKESCQIRHGTHDIFMETCECNSKAGCNSALASPSLIESNLLAKLIIMWSLLAASLFVGNTR